MSFPLERRSSLASRTPRAYTRAMGAVCMLSNLYPPVPTGSATQSAALAEALAARGHEVVAITARTRDTDARYERRGGVHVYRLPCLRMPPNRLAIALPWVNVTASPGNVGRVLEIARRHDAAVLHAHNHMFDLALVGRLARERLGIPLVVTVHTIIAHPDRVAHAALAGIDGTVLRRLVIGPADAVIAPDVNVLAYVGARFGRGDAAVVPYGVAPHRPAPATAVEALRRAHGLVDRKVILSVGHVSALRHRLDLVRAMPAILRQVPEATLVVIGAVADARPVEAARQLGLGDAVQFLGALPHDEIAAWLTLASLESHWLNQDLPDRTSLGLATMEAMMAARCCVASVNPNTFGPGELRDGEHLVVPPRDDPERLAAVVAALLRDPARAAQIGDAARAAAERLFSWDEICRQTVGIYASVGANVGS
jgi:glycosyltransferase involved in cell wall biosynthesis